ncbi:MAG: type II secretion system protein [Vibrio sp.]
MKICGTKQHNISIFNLNPSKQICRNKNRSGFSLLELTVVIVVISLIAVIALPKFIQIVDKAKISSIEGVAAGYAAAVISARAQWEVAQRPKKESVGRKKIPYNYIELDGSPLWLTDRGAAGLSEYSEGFPISVNIHSKPYSSRITNDDCVLLMDYLLQNPPLTQSVDVIEQNRNQSVRYLAKAEFNSCVYFQQEGANHSFKYEIKTGRVTVNLQPDSLANN